MWLGDLPSPSINFPCGREKFRQLPSTSIRPESFPSTFRQLLYISVRPVDLPSTSIHFSLCQKTICPLSVHSGILQSASVKFPHKCTQETFRQLPLIFRAAGTPFFNCHQVSMRPGDLPSTCVNFLFGRETFCQLP